SSAQDRNGIVNNPEQGLWQNIEKQPLTFELERVYGNNKNILFPRVILLQGPVADQKGNIYVLDAKSSVLYSFAPNGKLKWKKGQPGRGPGDFLKPRGLIIHDGNLYTVN